MKKMSGLEILKVVLYCIVILGISGWYLYTITQSWAFTIIFSVITTVVYYYSIVLLKQKADKENYLFNQLQLYVMTIVYHMERGNNVYDALLRTRDSVRDEVRADIDITLQQLDENMTLDTRHFYKYKFSGLNIFHYLLDIKYDKGGNAKDIFKNSNLYINHEIEKREKLLTRLNTVKIMLMIMVFGTLAIPLLFSLRAEKLYIDMFLGTGLFAHMVNAVFYSFILISLYFIGRGATKLSFDR